MSHNNKINLIDTIKGFPNYEVDTNGNIYSKERIIHNKGTGHSYKVKRKKLKPRTNLNGYSQVSLYNGEIRHVKYNHRVAAETFINNPDNKPQVNHIDSDKSNNNIENLEWTTNSENMMHAQKNNNQMGKSQKILCIEENKIYSSISKCAKDLSIKYNKKIDSNSIYEQTRLTGYGKVNKFHFKRVEEE